MLSRERFDVVVIGGGINGLSTAYALSHDPDLRVALLEQYTIGHERGGSHGASRITRTVYSHPGYVRLMQRAHQIDWPELEKEAGERLIHPNPSCYFGNGASFEKYIRSIENSGLDITLLEPVEARRLFPQFRFAGADSVLLDRTGGVIAAEKTIQHLKRMLLQRGVK